MARNRRGAQFYKFLIRTRGAVARYCPPMTPAPQTEQVAPPPAWPGYAWAIGGVALATLVATPLLDHLALVNIDMLFLVVVVVVAYLFGRGPATAAALLGVAAFDFFFVPPRFSFAVADAQYLLTFAVMLATGLVIAQLTSRLRSQADDAIQRESRSHELYELARALSAALADEQIREAATLFFARCYQADIVLLQREAGGDLSKPAAHPAAAARLVDTNVARAVFVQDADSVRSPPVIESGGIFYLPLRAPMRMRGVLVVLPAARRRLAAPATQRQMATAAALIAIALERVHFVSVARDSTVLVESERLRNTLLAALSHDLRTPLTAILGSAESLRLDAPALSAEHMSMIDAIRSQAQRTSDLVDNILDMARLESGEVRLRKEWQSLEEIIGSALAARASMLSAHVVEVALPPDLPLVECDALLLERVFVNLLENAAKYTLAGSRIHIRARATDESVEVEVADNGPGIERGREDEIFGKFVRGASAPDIPGLGLGLAICRAIVAAHGGVMRAGPVPEGGAVFTLTLPRGAMPALPAEAAEDAT